MAAEFTRSPRRRGRGAGQVEGASGLEVYHKLILGRRLHRQVGGLLTLQNAIDIRGRATYPIVKAWPVTEQSAILNIVAVRINRGQLVASRKADNDFGASWCNSSTRLAPRRDEGRWIPVTWPPGWLRLSTKPQR